MAQTEFAPGRGIVREFAGVITADDPVNANIPIQAKWLIADTNWQVLYRVPTPLRELVLANKRRNLDG